MEPQPLLFLIPLSLLVVAPFFLRKKKKRSQRTTPKIKKKIKSMVDSTAMYKPDDFLSPKKNSFRSKLSRGSEGRKLDPSKYDFEGIYVIHNLSLDKYYVGQSVNVYQRVHNHFSGNGCPDVYKDYKRFWNRFTIQMLPLKGSGFSTLNEFERHAIATYRCYRKGYNKTRGNAG